MAANCSQSALIDDGVLDGIRACADLAPLHNPKNLEGIVASSKRYPGVPQAAVFDTAFHQTLPEHAFLYAVPYDWYSRHRVRRYGFHGTSHRYVAHRYRAVRKLAREQTNIITLHLGNGCSMAAIKAGRSIDTSMGMTPLEGLMMGTRSGDLDPGILSVVASRENMPLEQVENALNFKSGLLGISGLSNDMRELQKQAEHGNGGRAALAIEIFCYRARKYLGAYLAAMGGADAIVFTGGIGENSAPIRARICEGFGWAGVALDRAANAQVRATEARISTPESKLSAYVIPTDEELLIARDTVRLILGIQHPS